MRTWSHLCVWAGLRQGSCQVFLTHPVGLLKCFQDWDGVSVSSSVPFNEQLQMEKSCFGSWGCLGCTLAEGIRQTKINPMLRHLESLALVTIMSSCHNYETKCLFSFSLVNVLLDGWSLSSPHPVRCVVVVFCAADLCDRIKDSNCPAHFITVQMTSQEVETRSYIYHLWFQWKHVHI